jgi:hypothetical protein
VPSAQPGIHGRVTINGSPAAGHSVEAFSCTTDACTVAGVTQTTATGHYLFANLGSAAAGSWYYTRWRNTTADTKLLSVWYGPSIFDYQAGTNADGGSFDVANVELIAPPIDASVTLPQEFNWSTRGIATDSYRLVIFNPTTGQILGRTVLLGNVDHANVASLPSGITPGVAYGWYPAVYDSTATDSYGVPYYYRLVTFQSTSMTDAGWSQPARAISDRLSDCVTRGPGIPCPRSE